MQEAVVDDRARADASAMVGKLAVAAACDEKADREDRAGGGSFRI